MAEFDSALLIQLLKLMVQTSVDYTIFFRELSAIPEDMAPLEKSFYKRATEDEAPHWEGWFQQWRAAVTGRGDLDGIREAMKRVNPKYTWREWLVVPAYQQAAEGDFTLIEELQAVLTNPFDEQSQAVEDNYYRLRPEAFFVAGGVSHYSCSS